MGGNVKWVYILYAAVLLPLIPTADLSENVSPMVASLNRWGIGWAGTALKVVVWLLCFPSFIMGCIIGNARMQRIRRKKVFHQGIFNQASHRSYQRN